VANNTVLNSGGGGDTLRDIDRSGVKTPVCLIDIGGVGSESIMAAGQATMANSIPVVIASNQNAVPASQSGTWTVATNADCGVGAGAAPSRAILMAGVYNSSLPAPSSGQTVGIQLDSSGRILVGSIAGTVTVSGTVTANQGGSNWSTNVAQFGGNNVVTGTGASGNGIPRVTVSNDSEVQLWDGSNGPVAVDNNATSKALATANKMTSSSGGTRSRIKSAASTNSTNLKASAGRVYALDLTNNTGSMVWFKLFDKASAPTAGTDTPAWTIGIPANGGRTIDWSNGVPFANGIGYTITGGKTDGDTTNTAADDVHGMILWV
jgi:hypothetical protein